MERRQKVILVSFGSGAHSLVMPLEVKQAFLHAFDQFPDVTFVWKYEVEDDNIAKGHDNIATGNWLPQNEILGKFLLFNLVSVWQSIFISYLKS